jgi:hypothetical protein
MRGYFSSTGGIVLVCALAVLSGTATASTESRRATFRVTLQATVTKDWDAVTETTEAGCPVSKHSVGRRTVRLRSARPTTVVATFSGSRISYSPAAVRFVAVSVSQSGTQTDRIQAPCPSRSVRSRCRRARRAASGGTFRFFRSAHDEISFRRARLPDARSSCPRESPAVRAVMPGLQLAQGELSESALMSGRYPSQTAYGTAEVETDLDGQDVGRVVERVHWSLTFTRMR